MMENTKNIKEETPKEFAARFLSEIRVDIDIDYCEKNNIRFDNHEIDSSEVDLFNKQTIKRAFDLLTSV